VTPCPPTPACVAPRPSAPCEQPSFSIFHPLSRLPKISSLDAPAPAPFLYPCPRASPVPTTQQVRDRRPFFPSTPRLRICDPPSFSMLAATTAPTPMVATPWRRLCPTRPPLHDLRLCRRIRRGGCLNLPLLYHVVTTTGSGPGVLPVKAWLRPSFGHVNRRLPSPATVATPSTTSVGSHRARALEGSHCAGASPNVVAQRQRHPLAPIGSSCARTTVAVVQPWGRLDEGRGRVVQVGHLAL
jgi:hypothetical protein